mmetsp:Transcript_74658/g.228436  ORF Transcript_74658/g.228436 Transcript_74658/m.228436 type:complete len:950 (-) Transcript_74658:81-2930(-)
MPRLSQPEVSQPGAIGAIADVECASSDTETLHDACARIEAKLDEVVAFVRRGRPPSASAELAAAGAPRRSSASRPSVRSQGIYGDMNLNASIASTPLHASASSGIFVASTLPLGWPHALEMREGWRRGAARATKVEAAGDEIGMSRTRTNDLMQEECDAGLLTPPQYAWCTIDPNSRFNMFWGLLSLAVLLYDVTLLPYLLAWDVPIVGWLEVSGWTTAAYWCIDVVLAFHTGFFEGGELKMNPRSIRIRYATTWFVPDAAVIVSDWVSLALVNVAGDSSGRGVKMLRFAKLGRMLRIVGMMRMFRVVRIFEDMAQRHSTAGNRLTFNMLTLLSGMLWVAHILTCMWFAVGKFGPTDTGARWVDNFFVTISDYGPEGSARASYLETSNFYQYMVAFHWATGQIALGTIDTLPTNSLERCVFVLAMMVGFLFGSMLVSMMSASMMDYRMMQKDKKHKIRTLRQYLRENEVSPYVAMPVQKQILQRLSHRDKLEEKDVPALALLSVALRSSLRFAIQRSHLMHHPMFRLWIDIDKAMVQRVCMEAVHFVQLRQKDDLFAAGNIATAAYSLSDGQLVYRQSPDSSAVDEETSTVVSPGKWLSEAALWSEWTHVGRAEALVPCQVLDIHAEKFLETVHLDMIIKDLALEYCKQFFRRVVSAGPPHAPWPNDLEVPYTDYCNLVVSMSREAQVTIGRHAVGLLAKGWNKGLAMETLIDEVRNGKCIVVATGEGDIIRVVSLVALRVERDDGHIFVQVAKWERDSDAIRVACQMPGVKQERDELVGDTVQRLFATKLQLLANKVDITGTTRENFEKPSKEYGVHTRYLKAVCSARLKAGAEIDAPVCRLNADLNVALPFHRGESPMGSDAADGQGIPGSRPCDPVDAQLLMDLQDTPVLVTGSQDDPTRNLYAWLSPDTFAGFISGGNEHVMKRWVASMSLSESPTPTSTSSFHF